MIQLSRAPSIFLCVCAFSQALSLSDAEIKKSPHQIRIVWSLSAAICLQREAFERNKKTEPPLNQLTAYESQGNQLCSHITRTPCENSDCKRFQCKNNPRSEGVSVQPSVSSSSEEQTLPQKNPGTGPNIIVRMKSQQKCEALTIPCGNKTAGCYVPSNKRAIRITSIVDSLKAYSTKTQAAVLNILKSSSVKIGLSINPLWITNEIIVKGASLSDVQNLLQGNGDVEEVRAERLFQIPQVSPSNPSSKTDKSDVVDNWNIKAVEVPKVLAQGITGKGILVGHIDTGVVLEHEALKNNFRGEYGWFDPYAGKPEPYDDHGHGTHTLGTAVGQTKDIGAAPGATWMSCKGCRGDGNCTESATKTCAQWILCPTKADGTDPDCSKAPDVVNNSWGDPVVKDGSDAPYQAEFDEIIQCWRSAGIIPVFCTGNSGWVCKTTWYPGLSDKVIAVGNVEQVFHDNGSISFAAYDESSRGPPKPRFAQVIKPEVGAPGTDIFSAWSRDPLKYVGSTGTSQAAPLVTGTIALLLQKYPFLQYDQVLAALIQSCSPIFIPWRRRLCGNISEKVWPNHHMGFGMINAYKVVFGAGTSEGDCQ